MVGRGLFGVFANKYPGVWFEESVVMVELQDLFKTLEISINPKCSLNDLIILQYLELLTSIVLFNYHQNIVGLYVFLTVIQPILIFRT